MVSEIMEYFALVFVSKKTLSKGYAILGHSGPF